MKKRRINISNKLAIRILYLIITMLGFNACENKVQQSDVIVLSTKDVSYSNTTKNGVLLSASIILGDNSSIKEYGFVYDIAEMPKLNKGQLIVLEEFSTDGFVSYINNALIPDTTYYVRSFVKTDKALIYGNEVSFYSNGSEAPTISKIEPEEAFWGDTIIIVGKNFDKQGINNRIWFNDIEVVKKRSSNDTIFVVVPNELETKTSQIEVAVYGKSSTNSKLFTIPPPIIMGISNIDGQYPDTITINGNYFSPNYSQVEYDGNQMFSFSDKKDEINFIVPYLGEAQNINIKLKQIGYEIGIEEKFKYNKQAVLGVLTDSIYRSDTITVYVENIDLTKVGLTTQTEKISYSALEVWKDSIMLTPIDSNYRIESTHFLLEYSVPNFLSDKPQSIHTETVAHKDPVIKRVQNPRVRYNGKLLLEVEGYYGFYNNGSVVITSEDGSEIEIIGRSDVKWIEDNILSVSIPENIYFGKYKAHLKSTGRYSKPIDFEVVFPEITSFAEGTIKRGQTIVMGGNYLPLVSSVYQLRHIESDRVFSRPWSLSRPDIFNYRTSNLIGKGEYQLELKFGDEVYPTPYTFTLNDYFEYNGKINDVEYYEKSNICFAKDRILYALIYDSDDIELYDLNTNSYYKIKTNITFSEVSDGSSSSRMSTYPTIVDDQIYIVHLGQLLKFNFATKEWDAQSVNWEDNTVVNIANINGELIVQNTSNEILKYSGTWKKIGVKDLRRFTFGFGNYFYTGYNLGFERVSLNDFNNTSIINSPLGYFNTYYYYRHLFTYKGNLYEALSYAYTLYIARLSPSDGSFLKLDPEYISSGTTSTRFFSDVNGDVFYLVNNFIYKFNPDETF